MGTYGKQTTVEQDYLLSIFNNDCAVYQNQPVEFRSVQHGTGEDMTVALGIRKYWMEPKCIGINACYFPVYYKFYYLDFDSNNPESWVYFTNGYPDGNNLKYNTSDSTNKDAWKAAMKEAKQWKFLSVDGTNITQKI